jgi:preprotein translocase subunit SecE
MAKTSPAQFFKQVRQEVAKVTWPTRKEVSVSTTMVFVMVVVTALFFMLIDQVFALAVKLMFGLGG